jgi:hypothetical protein
VATESAKRGERAQFAPVVVEPSPATGPELGAILLEMKDARIQIGANAPSTLIAATLKALRS